MPNYLKHYGIPGMRWGVRRKNTPGSRSAGTIADKISGRKPMTKGQQLVAAKKAQRNKWREKHFQTEAKFLKKLEQTEKKTLAEFEKDSAGMNAVKKHFAKKKLERKMVDAWAVGLETTYQGIKAQRKAENRKRLDKEIAAEEKTILKFHKIATQKHGAINKQNLPFLKNIKAHMKVDREIDEAFWNELADAEIRYARG